MRKIQKIHYKTITFIFFCLLIYGGTVWLAHVNWPNYMRGAEPIIKDILDNPSPEKIDAARNAFKGGYIVACILTGTVALLSYGIFIFTGIHNFESFHKNKVRWLLLILFINAQFLLGVWTSLFHIPAIQLQILGALPFKVDANVIVRFFGVILLIVTILFYFVPWRKNEKKMLITVFSLIVDGISMYFSNTISAIIQDIYSIILNAEGVSVVSAIINAVFSLAHSPVNQTYPLRILMQFFFAAIPAIPLVLLVIWSGVCMPKSIGVALSSGKISWFSSLEK